MSSFSSASLELPLTSAFCPKAEGLASQYLKGKEEEEGQKLRHTGGTVGRGHGGEEWRGERKDRQEHRGRVGRVNEGKEDSVQGIVNEDKKQQDTERSSAIHYRTERTFW
jgi:hypothetical protein